jgi:hypothetical protein
VTPETRFRLQIAARLVRGPAMVGAVYFALRFAFAALTEDDGLLTPSGLPNLGVAALGLVVLLLRLVVVLVLPSVIAWRAVRAIAGKDA